jgi:hypothetical protein
LKTSPAYESKHWWLLGGLVLLAVGLRFLLIGKHGLWFDEAHSWYASQIPLNELLTIPQRDAHLPLYFLVLRIFLVIFPDSEGWLRAISALFSIGSLIVLVVLAKRWWGFKAAFFAGWMLVLSTFDLYYAQETRMFSMQGFLWLCSIWLLIEALAGKPGLFYLWGAINVALSWTQFYGALVAGVNLALGGAAWLWLRYRWSSHPFPTRAWLVGSGLTLAGLLGLLVVVRPASTPTPGGGAWIPTLKDLAYLYSLTSVGLTAARQYFLDKADLVLPALSTVPARAYFLVGLLFTAPLATWGIFSEIRPLKISTRAVEDTDLQSHRLPQGMAALLLLGSALIPIVTSFLLSIVIQRPVWALKTFLAPAYIFYLFCGIGLSRLPWPGLRQVALAFYTFMALLSLIPYYTGWDKADQELVFAALPSTSSAIITDRLYTAALSFYYMGSDATVIGLNPDPTGDPPLLQATFDYLWKGPRPAGCESDLLRSRDDWYVYGFVDRILEARQSWPECLQAERLWTLEDAQTSPVAEGQDTPTNSWILANP